MTSVEMHLHSYSFRFHFIHKKGFDVFNFIALAAEKGFTGVNISANGPGNRHLGGESKNHFESVRAALEKHGLNCELDTSDTCPDNLHRMLEVAKLIGADKLRVYTRYHGDKRDVIAKTIRDLREVVPKVTSLGISIVLENHEDFRGAEVAQILKAVNHPLIRALYDYGNSQMIGEDPITALDSMQPFVTAVHMKDHQIIRHEGKLLVQGVTLGQGKLPIMEQTLQLLQGGLHRFCFENVWAYTAAVQEVEELLPSSDCFEINEGITLLNGNELAPEVAINGEYRAFIQGWQWLQQELQEKKISILRNSG